jgi:hypothetical protein
MAWKGNSENPVPNLSQFSKEIESEKKTDINRADQTRRDTDTQKNFTVSLIDIDTTIMKHVESLQLHVIDNGSNIKVPLYYASPEKWKSIQRDGVIRDYNGKMLLPALVFKRVNSEKDQSMIMFNRYLNYTVLKVYSEKNRYTPFNLLVGENVPINEVYDVLCPDHMVFTYHFIIWTEYVEQMNTIVERLNFETEDYWGDLKGFRFRTRIDTFSHNIELQVDQDRIVKTEFDLIVHGYLLPDTNYAVGGGKKTTTQKKFTPKKIVMGVEIVGTNFDMNSLESANREKWRKQSYPNLQKDVVISAPPVVWSNEISIDLLSSIKSTIHVINGVPTGPQPTGWTSVPQNSSSPGIEGNMAYDSQYLYVHTNGNWKRMPLNLFS